MSKTQQKLLALFVVIVSLQTPAVLAQSATEPEASNRITSVASQLANTVTSSVVDGTESLINNAMQLIGVRYRWGGNTPQSGLDCSGFVRYVFNDTFGFLLPRKSAQMSQVGLEIRKDELRPGDLVFFNTMRHAFSHVGIYVGDNKFIHAPSKGKSIRVDDMTKAYWEKRYNGARRMEGFDAMTEQQRQQLLLDYQERIEKSGRL
ncbi:C40 family peptidase [Polynucleobacter victoriensis]|uniref:Cell wall-associated hydrolase, NlpC family n=1 Tax=Polynucleobacter victoriensis TaxID=2049319 RepID=A0A212T281_9BURK|nr:C40 family peptidase [Polynucleobacter victoriensis]SNC60163.1 Cell wall-associated hydrolase, NlpC family [Polynucleobacter victoriensis]